MIRSKGINNESENHMVLPAADPDAEPEVVELDPDTAYDTMRSDRDHEQAALLMHLGAAINHITTHASFDQFDLIALLKRARNYIDEQ